MGRVRRCRNRWVIDFRMRGSSAANISTDILTHTSGAPAAEPVTVRAADASATGFVIPPPLPTPEPSQRPGVRLDWSRIETILVQTAAVAAVLAVIFADDPPAHLPSAAGDPARTVAGLDVAHAALARALAQRRTWRRTDFEAVARRLGLLVNGALEQINDAAVAQCGELLCNGDDPIAVSARVAKQLGA